MPRSTTLRQALVASIAVAAVLGTTLILAATQAPTGSSSGHQSPGNLHYAVTGSIEDINVSGTPVGFWPQYVIYDSQNGMLYVASENSQTVSVVDPNPFQVTQVIHTGADARGLALDPATGLLFVSNDYASNLTVINTTSNTIVKTLNYAPYGYMVGEQLDPATGQLLVLANNPPDSILSINPDTFNLTRVLPIDPNPGGGNGLAIDPSSHVIYFPSRGDLAVTEIGELNGTSFANVVVPGDEGPTSTFLDPLNGYVYVMLGGWLHESPGNQLVVLDPTTNQYVGELTVGSWPDAYAYNASTQLLYVSCAASGNISIIDAATNQVAGSIDLGSDTLPGVIAIDPVTGDLYIGEDGTGALIQIALVDSSVASTASAENHGNPDELMVATRWIETLP